MPKYKLTLLFEGEIADTSYADELNAMLSAFPNAPRVEARPKYTAETRIKMILPQIPDKAMASEIGEKYRLSFNENAKKKHILMSKIRFVGFEEVVPIE